MEGMCIPCPECGWQNPNIAYGKWQDVGNLVYTVRCLHCGWHGMVMVKADYKTTAKGKPEGETHAR